MTRPSSTQIKEHPPARTNVAAKAANTTALGNVYNTEGNSQTGGLASVPQTGAESEDNGGGDTAELMERLAMEAPNFHGRQGKRKVTQTAVRPGTAGKRRRQEVGDTDQGGPWRNFRSDGYHQDADSATSAAATNDANNAGSFTDLEQASKQGRTQAEMLKSSDPQHLPIFKYIGEGISFLLLSDHSMHNQSSHKLE